MVDRSFLFVPGHRPDRFEAACHSGAHGVVLDLEDAVAPASKAEARRAVDAWLRTSRDTVWLRVNGAGTSWFADDLTLLDRPGVRGVLLPKSEEPEVVGAIRQAAGQACRVMPMIESARGLWNVMAIATTPGVTRLAFGSVDFQLDLGITGERDELLYARSQLVLASRVAGLLPPVDGVTMDLDDAGILRDDVRYARRLGFGGKLCVHPRQVAAVNEAFRPTATEVAWARRVVEAARQSADNAARLDGTMIDRPVIERAQAILREASDESAPSDSG